MEEVPHDVRNLGTDRCMMFPQVNREMLKATAGG